jgi:hypothetical protein
MIYATVGIIASIVVPDVTSARDSFADPKFVAGIGRGSGPESLVAPSFINPPASQCSPEPNMLALAAGRGRSGRSSRD